MPTKVVGFFKTKRKRIQDTCGLILKKRTFAVHSHPN